VSHPWPRPLVKGIAGGSDRALDIFLSSLRDGQKEFLGRWRDYIDRRAGGRYDPVAANEETVRMRNGRIAVNCRIGHIALLSAS
jgi:hypothetical protein